MHRSCTAWPCKDGTHATHAGDITIDRKFESLTCDKDSVSGLGFHAVHGYHLQHLLLSNGMGSSRSALSAFLAFAVDAWWYGWSARW
jgi:hypothetical protein